jgi:hypothetical protein
MSKIKSIQKLVFWNIIKKYRVGLKCTNRYELLNNESWKLINEDNLREYSKLLAQLRLGKDGSSREFFKVSERYFRGFLGKLQEFPRETSIVRILNSKDTQKKENISFFNNK